LSIKVGPLVAALERRRGKTIIYTPAFQAVVNLVESKDGNAPTTSQWPGGYVVDREGNVVPGGPRVAVKKDPIAQFGEKSGVATKEELTQLIDRADHVIVMRGVLKQNDAGFLLNPPSYPRSGDTLTSTPGRLDGLEMVMGYANRLGLMDSQLGRDYPRSTTFRELNAERQGHTEAGTPWTMELCAAGPHCESGCVLALADHILECMRRFRGCAPIIDCLHPATGTHVQHDQKTAPLSRGPSLWRSPFTATHVDQETAESTGPVTRTNLWAVGYVSGPRLGENAKELIFFPPDESAGQTDRSGVTSSPFSKWLGKKYGVASCFNLSEKAQKQDTRKTNFFTGTGAEWLNEEGAPRAYRVTLQVGDFYVIPPGMPHTFQDYPGATADTSVTVGFTAVPRTTVDGCTICAGSGAGAGPRGRCRHQGAEDHTGEAEEQPKKKRRTGGSNNSST